MASAPRGNRSQTSRLVATVVVALGWLSTCLGVPAAARVPLAARTISSTATFANPSEVIAANFPTFEIAASTSKFRRVRWFTPMPSDRIEVNTATALLYLFRNNTPVFATRVVVGRRGWDTPELQASIESVLFNPSWYVPRWIAASEILPKLRTNPGYLRRHNMVIQNGSVVQLPGPRNALGQLKFEMPNAYDVYLHDTPLKRLFDLNDRRQSHGCVRVQNPRQLAALLLGEPVAAINNAIALGYTHRQFLPTPMPVFIFYRPISAASATMQQEDVPVC